ncbi:MAG: hypothetical protein QM742_00640 [Aquabacterium sp.]
MTSTILRSPLSASIAMASVLACVPLSARAGMDCGGCSTPILTGQTTGAAAGKRDSMRVYAGVNWVFGAQPELVVGVRSVRTNARHKSLGGRFEASFPFSMNSIAFDKLRLRGVGGHRTALAEVGVGYSFVNKQYLLSAAVQGRFANVGTDYVLGGKAWQPFVGLNSLDRLEAPAGTVATGGTLSCADPTADLVTVTSLLPFTTSNQLNGYTCALN